MSAGERAIRVGVTGHRAIDEPEAVALRVHTGLRSLLALAGGEARSEADDEAAGARVRLEVVSPLAEGADRLVAHEVLATPGATLVAPLPFAADDYVTDFVTLGSRREFDDLLARARSVEIMPMVATREAGYEQVGRWVIEHCDVLFVLWDGRPARGQGGTADMVAFAADRSLPLLWVRVNRR